MTGWRCLFPACRSGFLAGRPVPHPGGHTKPNQDALLSVSLESGEPLVVGSGWTPSALSIIDTILYLLYLATVTWIPSRRYSSFQSGAGFLVPTPEP